MTDWDDIRYFLAVARKGNVTTAAKTLGVNHSTVSRRIKALEVKHGVRLFERVPSGYEMTEAANNIYELALDIEAKNLQVSRQLFGQDSRLQGEINLTMPHDILDYCLISDLAIFRQQHPEIQLNLHVTQGLKNLAAREADVAVRLTPSPPDYLIGKQIAQLQHGIYSSSKHLPSPGQPTSVVVWSHENHLPPWVQEHFPNAEIAMRVDDLYSMFAAVAEGIGIARMPCYIPDKVSNTMPNTAVRRLPIDVPVSDWGVWVLSHIDLRHTARVRHCREFLIERLQKHKALFEGESSQYL